MTSDQTDSDRSDLKSDSRALETPCNLKARMKASSHRNIVRSNVTPDETSVRSNPPLSKTSAQLIPPLIRFKGGESASGQVVMSNMTVPGQSEL